MIQLENYYKEKICMLKDILRKEKQEKEIQYREQLKFISKLERDKKSSFKQEVDKIFQQFDEEDRNYDFKTNRDSQITGILKAYYK